MAQGNQYIANHWGVHWWGGSSKLVHNSNTEKRIRQDMQENDYDPIKTLRVEEVRGIPTDVEEFNRKLAEAEALAEAEQAGLDNKQSRA